MGRKRGRLLDRSTYLTGLHGHGIFVGRGGSSEFRISSHRNNQTLASQRPSGCSSSSSPRYRYYINIKLSKATYGSQTHTHHRQFHQTRQLSRHGLPWIFYPILPKTRKTHHHAVDVYVARKLPHLCWCLTKENIPVCAVQCTTRTGTRPPP